MIQSLFGTPTGLPLAKGVFGILRLCRNKYSGSPGGFTDLAGWM